MSDSRFCFSPVPVALLCIAALAGPLAQAGIHVEPMVADLKAGTSLPLSLSRSEGHDAQVRFELRKREPGGSYREMSADLEKRLVFQDGKWVFTAPPASQLDLYALTVQSVDDLDQPIQVAIRVWPASGDDEAAKRRRSDQGLERTRSRHKDGVKGRASEPPLGYDASQADPAHGGARARQEDGARAAEASPAAMEDALALLDPRHRPPLLCRISPVDQLPQFRSLGVLGQGANAKVREYASMNGDHVAVKVSRIPKPSNPRWPGAEGAMPPTPRLEAEIMRTLASDRIVRYLGYHEDRENGFLIMELAPSNLAEKIKEGPSGRSGLPEDEIRHYTRQLLEALDHMHRQGYVHCDLKPDNVMLFKEGDAKLGDFGSTRSLRNGRVSVDQGLDGFTPIFMAPELAGAGADEHYDAKVDIWSLGCLVLEMASGLPPWHERGWENSFQAIYFLGTNKTALPAMPGHASPELKAFLNRCLLRNPAQRADAAALLRDPFIVGAFSSSSSGSGRQGRGPSGNEPNRLNNHGVF